MHGNRSRFGWHLKIYSGIVSLYEICEMDEFWNWVRVHLLVLFYIPENLGISS